MVYLSSTSWLTLVQCQLHSISRKLLWQQLPTNHNQCSYNMAKTNACQANSCRYLPLPMDNNISTMLMMAKQIRELAEFTFDETGPPRYEQLAAVIERAIRSGELPPGDRLPTVRRLSSSMSISATTISSAFDLLGTRGFIRAEVGRGTFVAQHWQEAFQPQSQPSWGQRTTVAPVRIGARTPWRRRALMRASSRLRAAYPSAMECSTGRPDPGLLPLETIRRAWTDCIKDRKSVV